MKQYPIFVTSLAVGYDRHPVAQNISFSLGSGEILTLIGPNGSGKSTLLKTLAGQLQRLTGDIALFDASIDALSTKDTAAWMSILLTERVRTEQTSCREVAAMGRYPFTGRLGILSKEDNQIVDEAMRAVGVSELAERDFQAISDGQRQRVLLARALAQRPKILILDEPTSYLDIRHKLELLRLLKRLSITEGLTVVLSLHEIDLAQRISDKILTIDGDGRASFGPPEEIFTEEKIRALFELYEDQYDPLYGSLELSPIAGPPRAFVLSSGGTGIPVYRRLQRMGVPFCAGILPENDADYRLARLLACEVISTKPYLPISDEALNQALRRIESVEMVIDAGVSTEGTNARMADLIDLAQRLGIYKKAIA